MSSVNLNPSYGIQAGIDPSGSQNNPMSAVDNAVAQLLGVSTSTLASSLASGQSMASLASAQGVSTSSLVSTIANALSTNAPSGAPTLSSDQLTTIATDIANGTQSSHHHHHGHHSSGSSSSSPTSSTTPGNNTASTVTDLAALLGLSPTSVANGISSGTSLSTLLSQSTPAATATSATAATANSPAAQQLSDPTTLNSLAQILGISSATLSNGLANNTSLSTLLAQSTGLQLDSYMWGKGHTRTREIVSDAHVDLNGNAVTVHQ